MVAARIRVASLGDLLSSSCCLVAGSECLRLVLIVTGRLWSHRQGSTRGRLGVDGTNFLMPRAKKNHDAASRILQVLAAIPVGRVTSYGQVASLAGLPRGARMVARVLRTAPESANLPWHRVLNARGCVAIPLSSPARAEQIQRLREEGVLVLRGRVDLGRFAWQPQLDELLWAPSVQDSAQWKWNRV